MPNTAQNQNTTPKQTNVGEGQKSPKSQYSSQSNSDQSNSGQSNSGPNEGAQTHIGNNMEKGEPIARTRGAGNWKDGEDE